MPAGGHNFVTTCMRDAVPPEPPIKVAIWAKSVNQFLALESSTLPRSLAVTFPWLCSMHHPHWTTCYISSLGFLCFHNVRLKYRMHWHNAISLCRISWPHSLNTSGHRLKSTSGMEPPLLPQTCDATPMKSKVAP